MVNAGKRVLVVEDGPTLTHGEMKLGAGIIAARKFGASEMVERILSMLTQFLVSNQSLQINKSFKVYIKILSINHMASREARQHVKRNKLFYKNLPKKKHYGSKEEKKKMFQLLLVT